MLTFNAPGNASFTAQTARVIAQMHQYENAHCVYEHWGYINPNDPNETEQCVYVGVCKLRDVFTFPDARANTEWSRVFSATSALTIAIIAVSDSIHDCMNYRYQIVQNKQPYCNVYGAAVNKPLKIICNETGETFESAAAACKAYDLSPSQLSNHLRGLSGYRTVKGKTFRKGIPDEPTS